MKTPDWFNENALAVMVASGEITHPYGIGGYYESREWREVAAHAVEAHDMREVTFMMRREEAWRSWRESADYSTGDFGLWCEKNSPDTLPVIPLVRRRVVGHG